MFTTDGVALRAASLNERALALAELAGTIVAPPGAASRTSTTWARQASHSGFTRLTTKSTASVSGDRLREE